MPPVSCARPRVIGEWGGERGDGCVYANVRANPHTMTVPGHPTNDSSRPSRRRASQSSRTTGVRMFKTAHSFRFVVPVCGSHTVYLCDTRMLRNVDRKSSYPHCGDNRVDNACDYPHIGDNSVDSLGTICRLYQIDLHQSRQSAMRSDPSGTHAHNACPAAGHLQTPITITPPTWRQ